MKNRSGASESVSKILHSLDVVEIEEPCAHDVQFSGLCVKCAKDMHQ